jgi:hypothetical protein
LKDLVSPTLAAETPTPEAAAAAAEAGADSDVDGHVTVAEGSAAAVLDGVSAEVLEGAPLLGHTTTAAAATAAAPAKGGSSVAAAVAELLQPICGNPSSSNKVTFLTSRRYGSKYSRSSSSSKARSVPSPEQLRANQSAVDAIPPYPYFGRVWDKWSKMKLASPVGSPPKGQGVVDVAESATAESAGLADSAALAESAAVAESAVPEMWSIQLAEAALADSAVVAEMWSRQQAQAAAATAAAVEAAALELGMLAAAAAAPADSPAAAAVAGMYRSVSAGCASDCEVGEKLAAPGAWVRV